MSARWSPVVTDIYLRRRSVSEGRPRILPGIGGTATMAGRLPEVVVVSCPVWWPGRHGDGPEHTSTPSFEEG